MLRNLAKTSKMSLIFLNVANAGYYLVNSYFIIYLLSRGLSYLDISFIFVASFITVILLDFVTGNFADRYGRMRIFLVGQAFTALAFLLYGLGTTFIVFLLAEIFIGVGQAQTSGAFEAWFIDQTSKEGVKDEAKTFFPLHYGITDGVAILFGFVASLLVIFALNLPFIVASILMIISILFGYHYFTDNYGDEKRNLIQTIKASSAYFSKSLSLRYLALAEMLRASALIAYTLLYQPYLVELGLDLSFLGIFFSFSTAATLIGSLCTIWLIKKFDKRYVVTGSTGIIAIAFASVIFVNSLLVASFAFILLSFSTGLISATIILWRNELILDNIRASIISLLSTLINFSSMIVYLLAGYFATKDSRIVFTLGMILAIAAIPLYLKVISIQLRTEEKRVTQLVDAEK